MRSAAGIPMTSGMLLAAGFALAFGGGLAGCSTAASMRVEVEVYKGPLSREPLTQVGELNGAASVGRANLEAWMAAYESQDAETAGKVAVLTKFLSALSCPEAKVDISKGVQAARASLRSVQPALSALNAIAPVDPSDVQLSVIVKNRVSREQLDEVLATALQVEQEAQAGYVRSLSPGGGAPDSTQTQAEQERLQRITSISQARRALENAAVSCADALTTSDESAIAVFTRNVADVATRMYGLATYITTSELFADSDRVARARNVRLATILGEAANQLSARADVLVRQYKIASSQDPRDAARRLSTGDYLRDAATTEFLSLFDVLDAVGAGANVEDGSRLDLDGTERVAAARQLFADQYWTKVNDVFATGRGDTRMAFVKDDIGNWNLKSFDSDPSKLLEAYRNVTLSALNTLAKVAAGGGKDVNLQRIQDLATDNVASRDAAARMTTNLSRERDIASANLGELSAKAEKIKEAHQQSFFDANALYKEKRSAVSAAVVAREREKVKLTAAEGALLAAMESAGSEAGEDSDVAAKKGERDRARDALAKSDATLVQAQQELSEAEQGLASVRDPYIQEMKALVAAARTELTTLSRVSGALETSAASSTATATD